MVTQIKSLNKSSDSRREAQAKTERDRGPSHVTGCSFHLLLGLWSVSQTFTDHSIFLLPISHRFMKRISVWSCCLFTFLFISAFTRGFRMQTTRFIQGFVVLEAASARSWSARPSASICLGRSHGGEGFCAQCLFLGFQACIAKIYIQGFWRVPLCFFDATASQTIFSESGT